VTWIPRSDNDWADALANLTMNLKKSVGWIHDEVAVKGDMNLVMFSDGGYRPASGDSAAAWVMCCASVDGGVLPLAAGGLYLAGASSMQAELQALELAVGALFQVAVGGDAVIPHDVDAMLEKLPFLISTRV
jgi:hypothetical protein